MTSSEILELIQAVKPTLSIRQARDHYHRTLKVNQRHLIKPKFLVAQATTTKQNATSVAQQWRWHRLIDSGLKFLRQQNTGLCGCGCNRTLGELIDHFVIGGDETCFMVSKGNIKVVAARGKKKHEKRRRNSCN